MLNADQGGGIGKVQVENVWDLVRRIMILANPGPACDGLVGGFRPDGTRFVGALSCYVYPSLNYPVEWHHRARRATSAATGYTAVHTGARGAGRRG